MESAESATETALLRNLWIQLTGINSAIETAHDQSLGLAQLQCKARLEQLLENEEEDGLPPVSNLANKQWSKHRALIVKLEEIRDSTRLIINEQLRPNLRPLKVLDLPDEILRHIFEYVRGETSIYELYFFDVSGGDAADIKDIKKLRLTCKRFCDNSSHLLMYYIKVNMTPESISHLTEVSQHPTISKGIRALKVTLGRHYDSHIAHDFPAFVQYQASRMWSHIESWTSSVEHRFEFDKTPTEVYELAIERAIPIAELWDDAAEHGLEESCPEHSLLRRAHQTFRERYQTQRLLERGDFAHAITSAMMRMPTATWLNIVDEDSYGSFSKTVLDLQRFHPLELNNLDLLQPKLEAPEFSWSMAKCRGLTSPPVETIPSILSSIHRTGITLKGLDLCVPLPDDLSSLSPIGLGYDKLRTACQRLKTLTFRPRMEQSLPLESLDILSGVLSTMLDTSALQRISLNFDFIYRNEEEAIPTVSMAQLLVSPTWPNLKKLDFNGPFYFKELQKVVNRIGKDADINWGGYLMDASWVEVLDFLRGRLSQNSSLGGMSGSIAGAECDDMTSGEISFIFERDWKSSSFYGSKATKFILFSWVEGNPLRDWQNGDLIIPESEVEDPLSMVN